MVCLRGRTDLTEDQLRYQSDDADGGIPLAEVLPVAGATVLLGVSGAGPIFTEPILQWMADNNEIPLIFPMSNPPARRVHRRRRLPHIEDVQSSDRDHPSPTRPSTASLHCKPGEQHVYLRTWAWYSDLWCAVNLGWYAHGGS